MKTVLVLVLVSCCALAWSTPVTETTSERCKHTVVDKSFVEKQRKVLSLFAHINQPLYLDEHLDVVKNWNFEEKRDKFNQPEIVDKMMEYYHNDYFLPKGEIFSITESKHIEQAVTLFELLYSAKDFEIFYKTAILARKHVNEGMFLYSFSVALVHRPDTYGIVLPPIYEIYPHYFFDTKTIQEAYVLKQQGVSGTIYSNYSSSLVNVHPEQSMAYYLEDVGMNSFYYTYHLYYPFWMNGTKYEINRDRRGELWLFIHQQMFSRYYLERLSNGFDQIDYMDFDVPVKTFFYPFMQYPNGMPFPERHRYAKVSDYFYNYGTHDGSRFSQSYYTYKDVVRRLADAINRGFVHKNDEKIELFNKQNGYDIIGNLLQGNSDSLDRHYYDGKWLISARHLMGFSYSPLNTHKVVPSVLEHMETTLRDPGFYQIYKPVMDFFHEFTDHMQPYTKKELTFPGVSIKKVQMDKIMTYFEEFTTDISQAVHYSAEEMKDKDYKLVVNVKQKRLNHMPFKVTLDIESEDDVQAVIKAFVGPKFDHYGRYINISENRWNFFELGKFHYMLKKGMNTIETSFNDCLMFGKDKTSFHTMFNQVHDASAGSRDFTVSGEENYFNMPQRVMLPKGHVNGLSVQFYFIVYPFEPYTGAVKPETWTHTYPRPGLGGPYLDQVTMFYPFDRPIKYGKMFYHDVPNSYFYDTKIYHDDKEVSPNSSLKF